MLRPIVPSAVRGGDRLGARRAAVGLADAYLSRQIDVEEMDLAVGGAHRRRRRPPAARCCSDLPGASDALEKRPADQGRRARGEPAEEVAHRRRASARRRRLRRPARPRQANTSGRTTSAAPRVGGGRQDPRPLEIGAEVRAALHLDGGGDWVRHGAGLYQAHRTPGIPSRYSEGFRVSPTWRAT